MSDIDMRFDGLWLLAALALGTVLYLLIALTAVGAAWRRNSRRAWAVARAAGAMCAGSLLVLAAVFFWWARSGTAHSGTDWADWMTVPWTAIFAWGCQVLARVGRA